MTRNEVMPSVFIGRELFFISAALVGGVSIFGGSGKLIGAVFGAMFVYLISIAMIYHRLPGLLSVRPPGYHHSYCRIYHRGGFFQVEKEGAACPDGHRFFQKRSRLMGQLARKRIASFFSHQVILVIALVILVVVFGIIEPVFFKPRVLFDLFSIVGEIGLMALGLTFVITTGGIDLGVGYNLQMSGIVFGLTWANTQNIALSIIMALITATLGGLLNGLIVSRTKIPPLVTTLATMYLFRGISMIIAGSNNFLGISCEVSSGYPPLNCSASCRFSSSIFWYSFLSWIISTRRGSLGRNLKGMGFNENAVIFSGVNTKKILLGIYTFLGLLCGVAAIVYLGRISAAKTSMGDNMNFEVITAVLLGGTSTMGGIGSMRGTLIGIIIIGVLKKGFSLLNFSGNIYNFTLGLILVLSLILFSVLEDRKRLTSRGV